MLLRLISSLSILALLIGNLFLSARDAQVGMALAFSSVAMVLAVWRPILALGVVSCGLLVVPIFGPGAVPAVVSGYLFGLSLYDLLNPLPRLAVSRERVFVRWSLLLVLLTLVFSLLTTLLADFDFPLLAGISKFGGWGATLEYLGVAGSDWFTACRMFLSYVIMGSFLWWVHGIAERGYRATIPRAVLPGLAVGSAICAAVVCLQLMDSLGLKGLNRGAFWQYVGRYSGSATDPNALGIVSFLVLPLIIGMGTKFNRYYFLPGVGLFLASLFSGSRTLFLALGLLLFIAIARYLLLQTPRDNSQLGSRSRVRLIAGLVLPICVFVLLGYPPFVEKIKTLPVPPLVSRVLETVRWDGSRGQWSSRFLYTHIGLQVAAENPGIGVGLGRFASVQDAAAKRVGIDLHGWRDNANNFYLQVLAEQGCFGLLLVLAAIYSLSIVCVSKGEEIEIRSRESIEGYLRTRSRQILLVLLLVLFTGPHVLFPEVLAVVILLIVMASTGTVLTHRGAERGLGILLFGAASFGPLLLPSGVSGLTQQGYGFYPREQEADGRAFVWSGARGEIPICEMHPGELLAEYRLLNPDIAHDPVRVRWSVWEAGSEPLALEERVVRHNEWQFGAKVFEDVKLDSGRRLRLRVEVARLWSPKAAGISSDPRWLGVQLRLPAGACK